MDSLAQKHRPDASASTPDSPPPATMVDDAGAAAVDAAMGAEDASTGDADTWPSPDEVDVSSYPWHLGSCDWFTSIPLSPNIAGLDEMFTVSTAGERVWVTSHYQFLSLAPGASEFEAWTSPDPGNLKQVFSAFGGRLFVHSTKFLHERTHDTWTALAGPLQVIHATEDAVFAASAGKITRYDGKEWTVLRDEETDAVTSALWWDGQLLWAIQSEAVGSEDRTLRSYDGQTWTDLDPSAVDQPWQLVGIPGQVALAIGAHNKLYRLGDTVAEMPPPSCPDDTRAGLGQLFADKSRLFVEAMCNQQLPYILFERIGDSWTRLGRLPSSIKALGNLAVNTDGHVLLSGRDGSDDGTPHPGHILEWNGATFAPFAGEIDVPEFHHVAGSSAHGIYGLADATVYRLDEKSRWLPIAASHDLNVTAIEYDGTDLFIASEDNGKVTVARLDRAQDALVEPFEVVGRDALLAASAAHVWFGYTPRLDTNTQFYRRDGDSWTALPLVVDGESKWAVLAGSEHLLAGGDAHNHEFNGDAWVELESARVAQMGTETSPVAFQTSYQGLTASYASNDGSGWTDHALPEAFDCGVHAAPLIAGSAGRFACALGEPYGSYAFVVTSESEILDKEPWINYGSWHADMLFSARVLGDDLWLTYQHGAVARCALPPAP